MNCQEFSEQVTEIAGARVMDAFLRDAALGHAEGCAVCAARLERERTLTAALRATAESFGDAHAPAGVETALLAAFRAGRDAASEPVNVRPFAPPAARTQVARFGRRARAAFAASAIAASLLFAFLLVMRAPQKPSASSGELAAHSTSLIPAPPSAGLTEPAAQTLPQTEQQEVQGSVPAPLGKTMDVVNREGRGGRPARVHRAAGGQSNKKGITESALAFQIDGGQAVFAEGDSQAATAEVAGLAGDAAALTDFVPLSAGASSTPLEGGQVVRVEAPRAALASLGLPVDARRAGETVRADLLLAHDGTAHAIRLVR
jgi:hypothetical protein